MPYGLLRANGRIKQPFDMPHGPLTTNGRIKQPFHMPHGLLTTNGRIKQPFDMPYGLLRANGPTQGERTYSHPKGRLGTNGLPDTKISFGTTLDSDCFELVCVSPGKEALANGACLRSRTFQ